MTTKKLNVKPTHDRVAVEVSEQLSKTAGGIIIPDSAKEKPVQGMVMATGPGAFDQSGKRIPMDVEIGDKVLFGKWSGTEIEVDGKRLLVMKESDIMAVIG